LHDRFPDVRSIAYGVTEGTPEEKEKARSLPRTRDGGQALVAAAAERAALGSAGDRYGTALDESGISRAARARRISALGIFGG
jgi:hypothetical protein